MGFDTIITNGRVVTATDTYASDVAIGNGKIVAIGQSLPHENASRIIDAAGKYVLPGGIDVHTHLDMPFGGTTSADDNNVKTVLHVMVDSAVNFRSRLLNNQTCDLKSCRRIP